MADIKANTDRMQRDVESLTACVNRINSRKNELLNKKNELDAMWDGPASEAFKAAFQDDLNALSTMIENLKKVYQYEHMAKNKYIRCENQVSGMIAEL